MRNVYRWGLIATIAIGVELIGRWLGSTEDMFHKYPGFVGSVIGAIIVYSSAFIAGSRFPIHDLLSSTTWGTFKRSRKAVTSTLLSAQNEALELSLIHI